MQSLPCKERESSAIQTLDFRPAYRRQALDIRLFPFVRVQIVSGLNPLRLTPSDLR
jgi:hypothetical protein